MQNKYNVDARIRSKLFEKAETNSFNCYSEYWIPSSPIDLADVENNYWTLLRQTCTIFWKKLFIFCD